MLYLIRAYGQRLSMIVHKLLMVQAREKYPVSCAPLVLHLSVKYVGSNVPHRGPRNPSRSTTRRCLHVMIQDAPLQIS